MGGSPVIGLPDTTPDYPLQKALFGTGHRIRLSGWMNAGANVSTSKDSNIGGQALLTPGGYLSD